MSRLIRPNTLTARLGLWVMTFVTVMFIAVVWVVLWFVRQTVVDEAVAKVQSVLNSATLTIDNALHEVETATHNMLWNVEHHLDDADAMLVFSRQMLLDNPGIEGCAIAFKPGYYPDKGTRYMAYYRREAGTITRFDTFGDVPFTEQLWYVDPVVNNNAEWIDPSWVSKYSPTPITTYSVPIHQDGEAIGVLAVDIALDKFSRTIQQTRPYPNTSCALLSHHGSFIIHPDSAMLQPGAVLRLMTDESNEDLRKLTTAQLNGESGMMKLQVNGENCYAFYRPFEKANWSIEVLCPEHEMLASYFQLRRLAIIISFVGILALLAFILYYIRHQLHPLQQLDASTQRLAEGHFDHPIDETKRQDELGRLQNAFYGMQRSMSGFLEKIIHHRQSLEQQGQALHAAYEHAQKADRAKTTFLNSATDQLVQPANNIGALVQTLHEQDQIDHAAMEQLTQKMIEQTDAITTLLDRMIAVTNASKDNPIPKTTDA